MTVRRAADALEYLHIHPTIPNDLQKSFGLTMMRRWLRVSQESAESQGHRAHGYVATRGCWSNSKVPPGRRGGGGNRRSAGVGAVGRKAGSGRGWAARGADRALPRLTMEAGPSGDFAAPCRRNAPRYGAVEEARVGGTTAGQGMKRAARGRQSRTSRSQGSSAAAEMAG